MSTKILVMSDSHGAMGTVRKIIEDNEDADIIFFLGDGNIEIRLMTMHTMKQVARVMGNNDGRISEELPNELVLDIDGYKMMLTHGHLYNVKSSYDTYIIAAKNRGCRAALFGHTHAAVNEDRDGIHIFNPGAASVGSYGIITTSKTGIEYNLMNV